MSFLRFSVPGHPTRLIDEGPSSALIRHQATVQAEPIGSMRPVIVARYLENRSRTKPPNPFSIHRENRIIPCRITMPTTGERCARQAGHADCHRSRAVMDDEARRRRRVPVSA